MSFDLTHRDDCETSGPWRLVRRTLGLSSFGMNLVAKPFGRQDALRSTRAAPSFHGSAISAILR